MRRKYGRKASVRFPMTHGRYAAVYGTNTAVKRLFTDSSRRFTNAWNLPAEQRRAQTEVLFSRCQSRQALLAMTMMRFSNGYRKTMTT